MHIGKVRALAFGPFKNRSLEFTPGMNVVFGPNESGKSSWQAAIFAGLCGMKRSRGAQSKEDREFAARHRPWDIEEWQVTLVLNFGDGRRWEFSQNLGNLADCSVLDLDTGRDVTSEILNEGTPDGAQLLGLDRKTFPATISIRQAEVLRVLEDASELQAQLQRAAASGGGAATAEEAIRRLKDFKSENVGLERRGTTRPLQSALNRLRDAKVYLEEATARHTAYLGLLNQLAEVTIEAGRVEEALLAAQRALAEERIKQMEQRLEKATDLFKDFPSGPPSAQFARGSLISEVRDALAAWEHAPPLPLPLEGRPSTEIKLQIDNLPDPPTRGTEVAPEVTEAEKRRSTAILELEAHVSSKPVEPEQTRPADTSPGYLRRAADDLERHPPEIDAALEEEIDRIRAASETRSGRLRTFRILLVLFALVSLGGGVLLAVSLVPAGAGALGVGVLGLLSVAVKWKSIPTARTDDLSNLQARLAYQREGRRTEEERREGVRRSLAEKELPADPDALRRLAAELESRDARQETFGRWMTRYEETQKRIRDAETQLRDLVIPRLEAPLSGDATVDMLLERYRSECQSRSKQATLAAQKPGLERELQSRQRAEKAVEEDRQQRDAAEREVGAVTGRLDIDDDDIESAVEKLRSSLENLLRDRDAWQQSREKWAKLDEMLGGHTLEDLESEVRSAREKLRSLPPLRPGTDPVGAEDAEARLEELEQEAQNTRSQRDLLRGKVENERREIPDVAAAEENHRLAEEELARVRRLEETLETTISFLEYAREQVHRTIAPRLAQTVESRIGAITGGRYEQVTVDPATLEVKVRKEGGEWREAANLSHGTAEQVYLLLRLGMADHLVTTDEVAPLIMDDITVQSDAARTEHILDLFHALSAERQIILFSQEAEVRSWATSHLSSARDSFEELNPGAIPA